MDGWKTILFFLGRFMFRGEQWTWWTVQLRGGCLMFMVSGAWLMGELAGNHAERARLGSVEVVHPWKQTWNLFKWTLGKGEPCLLEIIIFVLGVYILLVLRELEAIGGSTLEGKSFSPSTTLWFWGLRFLCSSFSIMTWMTSSIFCGSYLHGDRKFWSEQWIKTKLLMIMISNM